MSYLVQVLHDHHHDCVATADDDDDHAVNFDWVLSTDACIFNVGCDSGNSLSSVCKMHHLPF